MNLVILFSFRICSQSFILAKSIVWLGIKYKSPVGCASKQKKNGVGRRVACFVSTGDASPRGMESGDRLEFAQQLH